MPSRGTSSVIGGVDDRHTIPRRPGAAQGSARVAARPASPARAAARRSPPPPLPHRHRADPRPALRHRRPQRPRPPPPPRPPGRPPPAGITGSGLVRASSTVKNARTCSARAANRRSHPRTVEAGRPSTAAIVRCPAPAAAASSAGPITAPASARRDRHHAGSSTCVAPHSRHRDRRGTSPRIRPVQDPHRPRPGMPPPAQHPAARRAGQLPARQLPFDHMPRHRLP